MPDIFRFKQFDVDQSGCAMKINTDGVLLGALVEANQPQNILDIGTGTGVIALMLAQRFGNARIDAVEIDQSAADTANRNFVNSPFAERMKLSVVGFEQFFESNPGKKYDLIVSNPPFFINSLRSPKANKQLAKHADEGFFYKLIISLSLALTHSGMAYLILPLETAELVKNFALENSLFITKIVRVRSYADSLPHREILALSLCESNTDYDEFVIYSEPKVYTNLYGETLRDFFTIF